MLFLHMIVDMVGIYAIFERLRTIADALKKEGSEED